MFVAVISFVLGTFDIIQCRLFISALCAHCVHCLIPLNRFCGDGRRFHTLFSIDFFLLKKRYEFKLMIVTRRSDFNPFNVQLILVLLVLQWLSLYFWSLLYGFSLICKHRQRRRRRSVLCITEEHDRNVSFELTHTQLIISPSDICEQFVLYISRILQNRFEFLFSLFVCLFISWCVHNINGSFLHSTHSSHLWRMRDSIRIHVTETFVFSHRRFEIEYTFWCCTMWSTATAAAAHNLNCRRQFHGPVNINFRFIYYT